VRVNRSTPTHTFPLASAPTINAQPHRPRFHEQCLPRFVTRLNRFTLTSIQSIPATPHPRVKPQGAMILPRPSRHYHFLPIWSACFARFSFRPTLHFHALHPPAPCHPSLSFFRAKVREAGAHFGLDYLCVPQAARPLPSLAQKLSFYARAYLLRTTCDLLMLLLTQPFLPVSYPAVSFIRNPPPLQLVAATSNNGACSQQWLHIQSSFTAQLFFTCVRIKQAC
jgi:hypothetical protein